MSWWCVYHPNHCNRQNFAVETFYIILLMLALSVYFRSSNVLLSPCCAPVDPYWSLLCPTCSFCLPVVSYCVLLVPVVSYLLLLSPCCVLLAPFVSLLCPIVSLLCHTVLLLSPCCVLLCPIGPCCVLLVPVVSYCAPIVSLLCPTVPYCVLPLSSPAVRLLCVILSTAVQSSVCKPTLLSSPSNACSTCTAV